MATGSVRISPSSRSTGLAPLVSIAAIEATTFRPAVTELERGESVAVGFGAAACIEFGTCVETDEQLGEDMPGRDEVAGQRHGAPHMGEPGGSRRLHDVEHFHLRDHVAGSGEQRRQRAALDQRQTTVDAEVGRAVEGCTVETSGVDEVAHVSSGLRGSCGVDGDHNAPGAGLEDELRSVDRHVAGILSSCNVASHSIESSLSGAGSSDGS